MKNAHFIQLKYLMALMSEHDNLYFYVFTFLIMTLFENVISMP